MPGPRAGSGTETNLERYLIPTVTVAPTGTSDTGGFVEQADAQAGYPEANSTNVAKSTTLSVVGTMSSTRTSVQDPTIIVIGKAPGVGPSVRQSTERPRYRNRPLGQHDASTRQIASSSPEQFASVMRFGVKRNSQTGGTDFTDSAYLGVQQNFEALSSLSVTSSIDETAAVIEAASGTVYLAVLRHASASTGELKIYAYTPATDTGFSLVSTTDFDAAVGLADISAWSGVAWAMLDQQLYLLTAVNSAGSGAILHVFSFDQASYALTLVSDPGTTKGVPILNGIYNGIAATHTSRGVLAAVGTGPATVFGSVPARTIVLLESPDLRTWGTATGSGGTYTLPPPTASVLGNFVVGQNTENVGLFSAICYEADQVTGYAGTLDGRLFKTANAGIAWTELKSPVTGNSTALIQTPTKNSFAIKAMACPDTGIVFACGESGLVMQTTNAGEAWTVLCFGGDLTNIAAEYRDTGLTKYEFQGTYNAIACKTTTAGWVAGDGGRLDYFDTSVSPPTSKMNFILHFKTEGTYTDIVVQDSGTSTLLLCGTTKVHDSAKYITSTYYTAAKVTSYRQAQFVKIIGANVIKMNNSFDMTLWAGANGSAKVSFCRTTSGSDQDDVIALTQANSKYYGLGVSGAIFTWSSTEPNFDASWTLVTTTGAPTAPTDFAGVGPTSSNALYIVAAGESGTGILASTGNITASPAIFVTTQLPMSPKKIAVVDSDTFGITTDGGIIASPTTLHNRMRPALTTLPSGTVILAVANTSRGVIEIWRRAAGEALFALVDEAITFAIPTDPSALTQPTTTLRPTLTVSVYGEVLCLTSDGSSATTGRISLAGADGTAGSWVNANDTRLGLPVGEAELSGGPTTTLYNATRFLCAFGGGRLLTGCCTSTTIYTSVARNFATYASGNPTHFVPIAQGVAQWVGVDDVRVVWNGLPAVNDYWTMQPRYSYPTWHMHLESPSTYWRTKTDNQEITMYWDRQAPAVTAILGAGSAWTINGVALFGTNFRTATAALSRGVTSPPTTWSSFSLDATVVSDGYIDNVYGNGVIYDDSKNWVPHQFQPGARHYYCQISASGAVYEVLDNGTDYLVLKNKDVTISSGGGFKVFSDRMFATATVAQIGEYRYGRYLFLTIPAQQAAQDYYKIGTLVMGIYTPYTPYEGRGRRRRYGSGFSWTPTASTITTTGLTGVSSTEHFGRVQQKWGLSYEAAYWWDRDMTLNGLMPKMRQAFCLQFNGDDAQSIELVQLVDAPEIANLVGGGDRYRWDKALIEVI